ncbi:uncharacterized protein N7443_001797 [Penicillium atrosanguineum]|uniref:uncharacterized protein n=1 Tax=Penicillium atrosanguineum TaxID=1132637 RepID=UPI0023962FD9|nr:uncharacterized protein N7443_001797 [Penicillium atrosanguineum]KAJ5117891.1 hypothetical protein N7526_010914 [Penicillium atrosanguineum]KAJ5309336.1 hypothetical protein N7443_001797 [Penicillium atrosanguineum]
MPQSARWTKRRSKGDCCESARLLDEPYISQSPKLDGAVGRYSRPESKATRRNIYPKPSSGPSHVTLRLPRREQYLDPKKAWWTQIPDLNSEYEEQKAREQERTRQDWLRRLRPRPRTDSPVKKSASPRNKKK